MCCDCNTAVTNVKNSFFAKEDVRKNAVNKGCRERLPQQRRWFVSLRPRLVRETNLGALSKCLQGDEQIAPEEYACTTCLLRSSSFTRTYPHGFRGVDKVSLFRGCTYSSPFSRFDRRCTHCSATFTLDRRQLLLLR